MSEGGGFSFSKPLHQAASRMSQLRKFSQGIDTQCLRGARPDWTMSALVRRSERPLR
jgi:hypothetical protein